MRPIDAVDVIAEMPIEELRNHPRVAALIQTETAQLRERLARSEESYAALLASLREMEARLALAHAAQPQASPASLLPSASPSSASAAPSPSVAAAVPPGGAEIDGNVILEEEYDPNYEPTMEEVYEYAKFLGIQLPEDEEFLPLARNGLKLPLPDKWKPCQSPDGEVYYFNFESGESVWEHPVDEMVRAQFTAAKAARAERARGPPQSPPRPSNSPPTTTSFSPSTRLL